MTPFILVELILFLFGIAIGSFLNVIILRLHSGATVGGRSRCFSCLEQLRWYDLIPVISYISIRGRCRYCRSNVSIQYPIVEIVSGMIFMLVGWWFVSQVIDASTYSMIDMVRYLLSVAFFEVLLAVSVYDIRHKIIPDEFSGALFAVALAFEFVTLYPVFNWQHFFADVSAGIGAFLFFAFFWYISDGRWMGFGDAKIAFSMGLFLGFPSIVIAIFSSFWIGAVFGICMLLFERYTRKSEVPFAPFLALGSFVGFMLAASEYLRDIMSLYGL